MIMPLSKCLQCVLFVIINVKSKRESSNVHVDKRLEGVASDVTGFYCMVRGSCFRCYRNIVWLEGVASDVTGILSG